jgi:alpha-L-fucosidase
MTENRRSRVRRRPSRLRALTSMLALTLLIALFSGYPSAGAPQASRGGGAVIISLRDKPDSLMAKAVRVRPSERQLAWQALEFQAFVHFGINTFTDREWGTGEEDPALFDPPELDARQWVEAFKAAGMRGLILTAKHHDGFCLWPSRFTEHSVKNSPWRGGRGDVVREVAEACREAGLKFGFYLSPWDRHEPSYGDSPRYNEHFRSQLRELLTDYGEISEVWFDGACGEGPNGKRQVYDWKGYWDLIRELQPGAVISIMGPDARWIGNEAGVTRESEWSVIPVARMDDLPDEKDPGGIAGIDAQAEDLGSRERIAEAARTGGRLIWYPGQVDVSIRPGWFYHAAEDNKVKGLDHLLDIFYTSVGGNAQLLLNVPPDKRGLVHENDVRRLRELGNAIRAAFAADLAAGARAVHVVGRHASGPKKGGRRPSVYGKVSTEAFERILGAPRTFNVAVLGEDLTAGQRVESFAVDAWDGERWKEIARGTTIGWKRLLRFPAVTADKARVRILRSRDAPFLVRFGLHLDPRRAAAESGGPGTATPTDRR